MSKERRICPICEQEVKLRDGITNLPGEAVMQLHFVGTYAAGDFHECLGSNRSLQEIRRGDSKRGKGVSA